MTTHEDRMAHLEDALTRLVETVNKAENANALAHAELTSHLSAIETELARHSAVEHEHHEILFGSAGRPGVLDLSRQNTELLRRFTNLGWAIVTAFVLGVGGFLVHLFRTVPGP